MKRLCLAAGLLSVALLAACSPPAAPTTAQITVVQPGIEAERRGNYGFALFTYRYWARFRVALAQYRLARLYEHGLGTDRDDVEVARWYRAASEIGYPPAHAALARLYEEGRGVPQDEAAAFGLYPKAAAGGDVDVHYRMGRLLERGRGMAADPSGAAFHYRIAAETGNAEAALALAELYRTGRGVAPDATLAARWYRAAAARGEPRGRYRLARLHADGDRTSPLGGRGTAVLDAGADAEADVVPARVTRERGAGEDAAVVRDATRAVGGYREAARHGDGEAALRVAAAFEQGDGVSPDLVEALTWYEIAQRQGYAPAASPAAALRGELPGVEVREASRRIDQWWQEFGS